MAEQRVDYGWLSRGGLEPDNEVRNGVQPGSAGRVYRFANFLLSARRKLLFSKSIRPSQALNASGTNTTWRFRFLTSPGEKFDLVDLARVRFSVVCVAAGTGATSPSVTVNLSIGSAPTDYTLGQMANGLDAGTNPDDYHLFERDIQLTRSTQYAVMVKVTGNMRPISISAYELQPQLVDPDDANFLVDTGDIGYRLPVLAETQEQLVRAADQLWTRQQTGVIDWSVNAATAVSRVSTTAANIFDQTVTAYSSTSAGFWAYPQYRHSLASTSVGIEFYCYASSTGTGTVTFVSSGTTLATLSVSGVATLWYTSSGNLNGENSEQKIDILVAGNGVASCSLYAAGAFYLTT